ncbi:hypothetical protein RUM43_000481 [Polyplax serrata]|uniref:Uncharacterized protein n=1 Tax=Polyplax serrata TaxID=468196 RepID=A0AAN8XNN1_POLSC
MHEDIMYVMEFRFLTTGTDSDARTERKKGPDEDDEEDDDDDDDEDYRKSGDREETGTHAVSPAAYSAEKPRNPREDGRLR